MKKKKLNMKEKQNTISTKNVLIILGCLIILFLGYKSCLLLYYRQLDVYATDLSKVIVKDKVVKLDKNTSNTKYKTMNIYIPKEMTRINKNTYEYALPNETRGNYTTYMRISESTLCFKTTESEDKRIQTMNYDNLMEKNNLKSEKDLIKYFFNKATNNNIFTSKNQIKLNYLSLICTENVPINPNIANNYYLNGSLDGILNAYNNGYYINVYDSKNNKYYEITIIKREKNNNYKEVITESELNKILGSIYFN